MTASAAHHIVRCRIGTKLCLEAARSKVLDSCDAIQACLVHTTSRAAELMIRIAGQLSVSWENACLGLLHGID